MKKEVYDKLAATGKYLNTGKVLIGLRYQPRPKELSQDEETMQSILLGDYHRRVSVGTVVYLAALAILLAVLVWVFR